MRFWAGVIGTILIGLWGYAYIDTIVEAFQWMLGIAIGIVIAMVLLGLAILIGGAILATPIWLLALLLGLELGSGDD